MTTAKLRQPTRQEVEGAIADLKRAQNSQSQLNRWARMSAEDSERWAKVSSEAADLSAHHSTESQRWAKLAKSHADKIDPLSIVSVCLGVSLLGAIVVCCIALSRLPQMPTSYDANITITP
jgi:hypothetical protein